MKVELQTIRQIGAGRVSNTLRVRAFKMVGQRKVYYATELNDANFLQI